MNQYFNQSQEWQEFFLKANDKSHDVIKIENNGISTNVFQYPFLKKDKFWYVPRLNFENSDFNMSEYLANTQELLTKIKSEAINNKVSYITIDCSKELLSKCGKNTLREIDTKLKKSFKKLQYLTTPILDTSNLLGEKGLNVPDFFKANEKGFFGNVNKTCRNLTRRALEKNWQFDVTKDMESFDEFWALWQKTAKRHNFNLHSKQYILDLLSFNWAELIVIKDSDNVIQSGGIIVTIGNSSIHLYGANSDIGLEKGSQYFFHVLALKLIREKNLTGQNIVNYDLGGSDDAGYGNFKKSYKPEYLEFDGPYDCVINPVKVGIFSGLRKLKSLIKK
jgi:lipid II:glycine glycyltransferase (peptidoglycan interpeptide bridge formation enzyme)